MYLEINLNDTTVQHSIHSFRPKPALEVFRVIDKASKDKKIDGIILNAGSFYGSREYLWELRDALEQFKSNGKKVFAYISSADMDVYYLVSIADKIIMDEQGTLSMIGYAWGRGYVRHSLEKLGISVRELRYLEYKSAAETYTRDSMSEADRRQYGEYLDNIFNVTRNTIIKARNWTDEEFDEILNRDFMFSAKRALNRKLIDRTGRKDAVIEVINEVDGAKPKRYVLFGDSKSSLMGNNSSYTAAQSGFSLTRKPVIAVVNASGQTDFDRGMNTWNLSQIIHELAENKRVKAVVIRVNSPGGNAEAADILSETIRYAKQKKPVVVSMGEVAASGGYWVSMNASHITATPYTLTGSIGVIASWFYDNGLGSKLGVTSDFIQHGNHADLMTGFIIPYRDLTAEEEERFKVTVLDLYEEFVTKAAVARNMSVEKIEAAAQGRVFSGAAALEAGLIDSIGGLNSAIKTAKELAKIPEGKKVLYNEYPKQKFFEKLLMRFTLTETLIKKSGTQAGAAAFFTNLLLPGSDIHYRIEHNGKAMPILPMEFF
ncbi:MAG: signal peptide peptidase SppA [Treponema sp.]|nr:signal peptide peptidase SppA [Treponema sp.]